MCSVQVRSDVKHLNFDVYKYGWYDTSPGVHYQNENATIERNKWTNKYSTDIYLYTWDRIS